MNRFATGLTSFFGAVQNKANQITTAEGRNVIAKEMQEGFDHTKVKVS
jgi:hypothetical protein